MKAYNDIVNDMKNYVIANMDGNNKVTAFHEGSVLLTLIEAFAGELEYIGIDIENELKKRLIDYLFSYFNHTKRPGTRATIEVKFTAEEEAKSLVVINAGTQVQDSTGLKFTSSDTVTIPIGAKSSCAVTCVAESVGSKYNIKADSEMELTVSKVGIDAVILVSSGQGGSDIESDTSYRQRFSDLINGFATSTEPGLINAIQEIDTLKKISLQEKEIENTHFSVYAINHSNTLTDLEIEEITQIVKKNKSCGVRFRVLQPKIIEVEQIHVIIKDYNTIHGKALLTQVIKESFESKINELSIGESLLYIDLVEVLQNNENIYNFEINSAPSDSEKILTAVGTVLSCKADEIFVTRKDSDTVIVEFKS